MMGRNYTKKRFQDFKMKYAMDDTRLWHFIETTQPEEFCKLQRTTNYRAKFISLLDRKIKKYGILHLLKTGIEIEDASFILFYVPPVASSSHEVDKRFESNEFSITRQVRYNCDKPLQEIDMVVFLNGLPISTIELKNTWTGQTAKVHGIRQYKQDRDYRQPLFDSVVVVTDRKILDKQISKNIDNFSEVKRIVAHADSSADLSNKNFAVIIDEAHSSQSGRAADNMNKSIGAKSETEDPDDFDWQDAILEAIRGRKMSSNASYIAFTATPKKDTLERFGILQPDGKYKPFHLYSMKHY